ncbi:hypothetical protein ACN47E_009171 [Coniothyrium glycines]
MEGDSRYKNPITGFVFVTSPSSIKSQVYAPLCINDYSGTAKDFLKAGINFQFVAIDESYIHASRSSRFATAPLERFLFPNGNKVEDGLFKFKSTPFKDFSNLDIL